MPTPVKKNITTLTPDISTQLETLRGDIATLAKTVKSQARVTMAETKAGVKETATVKAEAAKEKYGELTSTAEAQIRQNPLTSVAVAVGVGLLLGAITRR